jgi:hypothetical protein
MQYVDFRLVRTIFENMGSPRIADIFRRLEESINRLEPSAWEEYYRTYFEVFDTVVSCLQDKGILSAECYHKIANLKSEAESILKERRDRNAPCYYFRCKSGYSRANRNGEPYIALT